MDDDRLDALLAAYRTAEPSAAARAGIVAAAPRERAIGRAWRWLASAGVGTALAASCAAGVAAGLTLAPPGVTQLVGGPPAQASADAGSLADPTDDPASG